MTENQLKRATREQLRKAFSAILMHTDEEHPLECYIPIDNDEAMGLSSLELNTITAIFQEPVEGIIWLRMEGVDDPIEFDEFRLGDLRFIYKELLQQ